MKKIPTVFVRDEATNRRYVTDEVTPGCEWVFEGKGIATRKYDGTCCLERDGVLYKRHEVKTGKPDPERFTEVDYDDTTGKRVGWVPVGDGPEDRWHREAFDLMGPQGDGTYELLGPKVQGNPEGEPTHVLIPHATAERLPEVSWPKSADQLRTFLSLTTYEGIVWHASDGRMAKLKKRDYPKAAS